MNHVRAIAWPVYVIAAMLVLFPLVDFVLTVLPLRPGDVTWRFGAAGLFSRALMTPLLGLLLVFVAAVLLEQRRVLRGVAVLSGVAALALLGTLGLFVLDTLQMRAQVRSDITRSFDVAALAAMAKYVAMGIALLALAIPAWRGSGKARLGTKGAPAGQADLVLRTRPPLATREATGSRSEPPPGA